MERLFPLSKDEEAEVSRLHAGIEKIIKDGGDTASRTRSRALLLAVAKNDLELLRLFLRHFPYGYRPFDIRTAFEANSDLGLSDPYSAVTTECMNIVSHFHRVLMNDPRPSFAPVDSQSLTILLKHVVATPDDLDMVLSIITEGRARGYIAVLKVLDEIKRQEYPRSLDGGFL